MAMMVVTIGVPITHWWVSRRYMHNSRARRFASDSKAIDAAEGVQSTTVCQESSLVLLPNYRPFWTLAGYVESRELWIPS